MFMNGICHQACFIARKTYLAAGGFETTHRTGADPRLLMRMLLRDRLPHRHVGRVVVCYQGGGVSAQPQNVRDSQPWCNLQKRELYSRGEYAAFACLGWLRGAAKRVLYDPFLWRAFQNRR